MIDPNCQCDVCKDPESLLNVIKKGVSDHGVFLMGVNSEQLHGTKITHAFVYSIGHKNKGKPDILVFLPYKDKHTGKLRSDKESVRAGSKLINYLVKDWDNHPVKSGDTAEDQDGYKYYCFSEQTDELKQIKEMYMVRATEYYNHQEFDAVMLISDQY